MFSTPFDDFLSVVLICFAIVLYAMGFRLVKKGESHHPEPDDDDDVQAAADVHPDLVRKGERKRLQLMLGALEKPPFSDVLSLEQRISIRQALLQKSAVADEAEHLHPEEMELAENPPVFPTRASFDASESGEPILVANRADGGEEPQPPLQPSSVQVPSQEAHSQPRASVAESIRSAWDPAVMMLYLGAFLVVIAGLIFATYNWGELGAWQKLGILAGTTIVFLVAGAAIRNIERVKPASTTFLSIGGLLVPANFLAAYTVFDDVQAGMLMLIGAAATAVVHSLLSYQPNAYIFRYSAAAAGLLAVASIPAAIGLEAGWGGVLALVVIALLPDQLMRGHRLADGWLEISRAGATLLAGFALWHGLDDDPWIIASGLVAFAMVAVKFSQRYSTFRDGLLLVSDGLLVLASMQFAHNLDGDRWVAAAGFLAVSLVLLIRTRTWPHIAGALELAAAVSSAVFVGEVTRVLGNGIEWALAAGSAAMVVLSLIVSRRRPETATIADGIAAFALPAALAWGVYAFSGSFWSISTCLAGWTVTAILYGLRHRWLDDLPFALASFAAIGAILHSGWLMGIFDTDWHIATLMLMMSLVLTAVANLLHYQIPSASGNINNLLRIEALPLFYLSFVAGDFDHAATFGLAMLALFWNLWVTRNAWWSLAVSLVMMASWLTVVIPAGIQNDMRSWWHLGLAGALAMFAWQLDRRTNSDDESFASSGIFAWFSMALVSLLLLVVTLDAALDNHANLGVGIALLLMAGIYVIASVSSGSRIYLLGSALFALIANWVWLFGDISATEHVIIGILFLAGAGAVYWLISGIRSWLGLAALVLGITHIQIAGEYDITQAMLIMLAGAWLLASLAIVRWRTGTESYHIGWQALALHGLALVLLPLVIDGDTIRQSDIVWLLLSLAGMAATFGALMRRRDVVLFGSGIGMSALMLQINLGSPGNIHAYSVPLSAYLLVVGILLRRDPHIANIVLGAGSAMLLIPALIEALTTGSLNWLWIAFAEALALFLLGTMLRLRIPTAAGVIAVSAIALRMLVFVISAFESWVGILLVGVALLAVGTGWLILRDAIQQRMTAMLSKWRGFN